MTLRELFKKGIPARYIMAIMSFFGFVFNYMLRININITIVAMVNYSAIERANDSGRGAECGFNQTEDPYNPDDDGPFPWNENAQSTIASSFFWGYILLQIPGGRLSEVIGGKWIFGMSIISAGILNLIFPLLAQDNPVYLIVIRILMGVCEGPTFPGMHAMLARWAPPEERSRIASIVYAGCQAGTLVVYPLASFITTQLGWEYVFYIMGSSSLVWGALWIYLVYDSPAVHPRIDKEELAYLEERIGKVQTKIQPVPWRALLTSMPFWAILIADIGNNWGFWMLLTELPIYMKHILNYDLQSNGFLSALPYLCMWIFSVFYGYVADIFLRKKWLNVKNIRKVATISSHFCGAIVLVLVTLTGCNDILTLVLLNLAVGLQGAIYTGFLTNHIDIAPNFAGTMYGITNCIASIPSFVAPLTAGAMTNGQQTLGNWRKVFYISAAFYAGGSIFFAIFADGEVQKWNDYGKTEDAESSAKSSKKNSLSESRKSSIKKS
ncbi:unnamed protein product [Allacma fusca]|uniref:Sialin n=1 Tax=Allacma fusca TaxID=39272 RepID=A0A8J2LRI2_9HEXA|nr:unnamed protein product [Allacma fusca]